MTFKSFKSFKLIIIVILVLIILFFIINDKKEHLINNSEVEKSFQTLAQLLSSNKLSVKPVDANTNIDSVLQSISASDKVQVSLPSNIVYDNGKYRDINNKFSINTDGTFEASDFIFQDGLIKNPNNTILYDPVTKKLKYNNVTYDGVTKKLEENDKKFSINTDGTISSSNFLFKDGLIQNANNTILFDPNNKILKYNNVTYDGVTNKLQENNNKFIIDNSGNLNLNAGELMYERETGNVRVKDLNYEEGSGNVRVKDLVYNKNADKITKGSDFVYDANKNLTLNNNNGNLLYTVDGIITAGKFNYNKNINKVSVGNLDYDTTKENEIIFGKDIMYDFNNKIIRKLDNSVIIDQEGKIMARKNNNGYDFTYDITGEILAKDLVYKPNGEISTTDLIYQNNIIKNKANTFDYNTITKVFNSEYTTTQGTVTDISDNKVRPAIYSYKNGAIIDSPNFYDEVIIMKKAADIGTPPNNSSNWKPLHIRKVFLYSMDAYTGLDNSYGTLIPGNESNFEVDHLNMDGFTNISGNLSVASLLADDPNAPNFACHGKEIENIDNVIRIKLKKPTRLASIRIDNRINGNQERIHKTIVYFRKNGVTLAKINLDAPTNTSNIININNDTKITDFPIYQQSERILVNRGRILHQPYMNNDKSWWIADNPVSKPSLYRFFGTGLLGSNFFNRDYFYNFDRKPLDTGGDWSVANAYADRPYIILPVPTIIGTIDQKD